MILHSLVLNFYRQNWVLAFPFKDHMVPIFPYKQNSKKEDKFIKEDFEGGSIQSPAISKQV